MTVAVVGEWTTVDKSTWGSGPWQDEPDKIHWIDPATDLDCLMVRQEASGHWCGYVAVAEGHPYFGVGYGGCTQRLVDKNGDPEHYCDHSVDVDVHGGLTFADFCAESEDPAHGVCHVPQPGRPDRVWWLGFDCHHSSDFAPGSFARWPDMPTFGREVYRTRAYVEAEIGRLARQLADAR